MSRRSRGETSTSLDLLLDAVCNTFGGVLFIAILVAVIVNSRHKDLSAQAEERELSEDHASPEEMHLLHRDLSNAIAEMEKYQSIVDAQRKTEGILSRPETRESVADLIAIEKKRDKAVRERLEALQSAAEIKAETEETKRNIYDTLQRLETVEALHAAAVRNLEQEREARTRTTSLPEQRSTTKSEVALVLRYQRLYRPYLEHAGHATRKINTDDFIAVATSRDEITLTPKPYRGLPVSDEFSFRTSLERKLGSVRPETNYLAIAVWEDSFKEFQIVKELAIALEFKYRVVPVPKGGGIIETHVPNPLVQ